MKNKNKLYSISLASIALICILIGIAGAEPYAYISNNWEGTVTVIDTATDSFTATVPVGSYPYGVAVTPDGTKAYVANFNSNTVSVINAATNTVTTNITVGSNPYGVAITPDGSKAYVTNNMGNSVSVIDTSSNTIVGTVNVGNSPDGIVITPDGTKAYVVRNPSNKVTVINTATDTVTDEITVRGQPYEAAVNPAGTRVYVTNTMDNSVSVINTANNAVITNITVGHFPEGVAITRDGTKAYVANTNSNTVSVINTATNTVATDLSVGSAPYGVAITPDGTKVYVTNSGSNDVSIINTADDSVSETTVPVGNKPRTIGQFIRPYQIPKILPVAKFNTNKTSGVSPVSIQFTDNSENATGVSWDFDNNGIEDSTDRNPVNVFITPGNYTVNLTATNENGTSSTSATINVIERRPNFTVDKIVTDVAENGSSGHAMNAGDVITYSVKVNNTGNVDLPGMSVNDSLINLTSPAGDTEEAGVLNLGENWTYTVIYNVTQANLNNNGTAGNGFINNTVTIDCDELSAKNASADVIVDYNPAYSINKTLIDIVGGVAGNVTKAGDVVNYQIYLTNDGNIDLTNVTVNDSLVNMTLPLGDTKEAGVLNVGENWTYNVSYTVTQEDIDDNGDWDEYINNTVAVDCDQLDPESSSTAAHIDQTPYLISKTITNVAGNGSSANVTKAGDVIIYQVNVTNYGGLSFKPVSIYDSLSTLTGPTESKTSNKILDPGENWTYIGNYTVTQEDLNDNGGGDGVINNTVIAYFYGGVKRFEENQLVGSESASAEVPVEQHPSYEINKTVSNVTGGVAGNVTTAGNVVSYKINLTNDGNLDLTNVTINDSLINLTTPIESETADGILNPGENWTYTGNYTVTQTDINNNGNNEELNGYISNTATVDCDQLGQISASAAVHIDQTPYLVNKTIINVAGKGPSANVTKAGDVITYQVNVTNYGGLPFKPVSIYDSLVALTGPMESKTANRTLDSGESWIYTGNYTVTQADLNSRINGTGIINNTVTVYFYGGVLKSETLLVGSKSASTEVPAEYNPSYMINKTVLDVAGNGSLANVTKVGDVINYQINVTNNGNIDLTNVTVNDTLINLTTPVELKTEDGILNPEESWMYNGSYTVTQADLNGKGGGDGFINNTAAVDSYQLEPESSSAAVPLEWNPAYNIDKMVLDVAGNGSSANVTKARDVINYQINLTNNGNIDLTNVTVNDSLINLTSPDESNTSDGILEVGENWTYNVNYTVTQAEINSDGEGDGFMNNTVTVDCDQLVQESDNAEVPIEWNPVYNINKTVLNVAGNGSSANVTKAGDVINYQIYLTNDGNVDLTNVTVNDSLINLIAPNESNTTDGILEVGENWTYNVNYTVAQAYINSNGEGDGFVNNTVTVDSNQLEPKSTSVGVPIEWNPVYNINKTVLNVAGNGSSANVTKAGDVINYQIYLTNDGNVDLISVNVSDSLINLTGPVESKIADGILNPGENWTYAGNYTITKADIGSNGGGDGFINNTATVQCDQLGQKSDSSDVSVEHSAAYSINNTDVNVSGEGPSTEITAAGDLITCQFNVTNDGNVDLTNVTVESALFNFTKPIESLNPDGILEPGENWTYTGNYTVTQADINNNGNIGDGFINDNITVNCNELESQIYTIQVPVERNPIYSIFKSSIGVDEEGDCIINKPNDIIRYRIVVKNEGNVDLTNVSVSDPMITLTEPAGNDIDPEVLNPGEVWVYTGNYSVTSNDINNETGNISNTATVSSSELPEKSSSAEMPIDRKVDLSIYKSIIGIDETGDYMINNPGDIINYQIAVRNNGDVDLTGVSVDDPMVTLTPSSGDHTDPGVLNPAETWVYTGNYTVTQLDIDTNGNGTGLITNTATVSCNELPGESSSMEVQIIRIVNTGTDSENNKTSDKVSPAADFSTSVTSGYTPLAVQFTDRSTGSPTSWSWDFNSDGIADSTTQSPVYTYNTAGTYTVNLTVSNEKGSSSKTDTITVLQTPSSSDGGSSGSSSGESSSGGSSGGSAEPANNVEAKEISQAFIGSGQPVKFDFPKNATSVVYVKFDSKKTFGKTTTIVEMLKGKSTFVSALPSDEVYKHVNIWIGNSGVVTNNIENAVVCFKVEKSWIQDKKIDQSSITLNRYSDNKWEQLQTTQSGEDSNYLYFTAKTPGFSPFAITGKTTAAGTEIQSVTGTSSEQNNGNTAANTQQTSGQKNNTSIPAKQSKKTPGFEIICGITALFAAVFLYRRK